MTNTAQKISHTPKYKSVWYRAGERDYKAGLPSGGAFDWSVTGKQMAEYQAGYRAALAKAVTP